MHIYAEFTVFDASVGESLTLGFSKHRLYLFEIYSAVGTIDCDF